MAWLARPALCSVLVRSFNGENIHTRKLWSYAQPPRIVVFSMVMEEDVKKQNEIHLPPQFLGILIIVAVPFFVFQFIFPLFSSKPSEDGGQRLQSSDDTAVGAASLLCTSPPPYTVGPISVTATGPTEGEASEAAYAGAVAAAETACIQGIIPVQCPSSDSRYYTCEKRDNRLERSSATPPRCEKSGSGFSCTSGGSATCQVICEVYWKGFFRSRL